MTVLKNDIYGVRKGRSLRLGKEATNGTQVLPTTYWRGPANFRDTRVVEMPDEDLSLYPSNLRGYTPATGAEIPLEATPATFEQLPILLDSGVKKVTPAADGGGTGYVSAYAFHHSPASPNSIGARSAEFGDNQEVDSGAFFYTREFTLSGESRKALMMSGVMEGRAAEPVVYTASMSFVLATKKITDAANGLAIFTTGMTIRVSGTASNDGYYTVATGGVAGEIVVTEALATEGPVSCTVEQFFTASATIPDVEEILFGNGKLYLGGVATAIGSLPQITNTWMGLNFKAICGQQAVSSGDGRLDFSFLKGVTPEINLDLTFEWNGKATAERRLAKLRTPRKFRMKFEGSTLVTAGTYAKKTVLIDGCGLWDTFRELDELNGNDVIKAGMKVGYNATAALYCTITVVNSLAAVL